MECVGVGLHQSVHMGLSLCFLSDSRDSFLNFIWSDARKISDLNLSLGFLHGFIAMCRNFSTITHRVLFMNVHPIKSIRLLRLWVEVGYHCLPESRWDVYLSCELNIPNRQPSHQQNYYKTKNSPQKCSS